MAMIDDPNKIDENSLLTKILPALTSVFHVTKETRPLGPLKQAMKVKPGVLTALLGGYSIGTLLDEQFDLSDMIAEALKQDPDMSGAKDMPSPRPKAMYPQPQEDYYEGETETTKKDLRMRRRQNFLKKLGL